MLLDLNKLISGSLNNDMKTYKKKTDYSSRFLNDLEDFSIKPEKLENKTL